MARSGGRRLVVAFFEHPAAAAAARLLKQRPRTVGPGGTVGVLTADPRGGLVAPAGPRGRGDDSGMGAVLDGITCALSGRDPPTPDELFGAGSDLSSMTWPASPPSWRPAGPWSPSWPAGAAPSGPC